MKIAEETLIIVSHILILIFALGALGNWWRFIRGLFGHRKGSALPILPGLIGAVALAIAPAQSDIAQWKSFWWLPLFIDVGCIPWAVFCLIYFARKRRQQNSGTADKQ